MSQPKKPGFWTTKSTDTLTVNVAPSHAAEACLAAGTQTKGWRMRESDAQRFLVMNGPGFIAPRIYYVEVLPADGPGGGTTLTLNGWTGGKGPGGTSMVKRSVKEFRVAIEERVRGTLN